MCFQCNTEREHDTMKSWVFPFLAFLRIKECKPNGTLLVDAFVPVDQLFCFGF